MFLVLISSVYAIDFSRHFVSNLNSITVFTIDLDDDGDIDIVSGEATLDIFLNNGIGGFINKTVDTPASPVVDVFSIDLDSDGDNDIIYAASGNILSWLKNDGEENFESISISSQSGSPTGIYAADMDNDNNIDVVVSYGNPSTLNKIVYFRNDGSESFTEISISSVGGSQSYEKLDVNDLDGDGDLDIVTTAHGGDELAFYESEGGISFTKHIISTSDEFKDAFIVDLDGDGNIDIISVGKVNISWFENDGDEIFTEHNITTMPSSGGRSIKAADLDGDGDIDIVSGNANVDDVFWLENIQTGFILHLLDSDAVSKEFSLDDIDNDGDLDFAFAGDDKVNWYENSLDLVSVTCAFPSLFCDNFNYIAPITTRGWVARNNDRSVDSTFAPIGNELLLNEQNKFLTSEHQTGSFPVNYRTSKTTRIIRSKFSPIYSSEFVLNFNNNTNNVLEYEASQGANKGGYIIRVEVDLEGNSSGNMNWFYLNNSVGGLEYILLCANCTTTGTDLNVKINTFFSHRDIFPFNASISIDSITLLVDNVELGEFHNFITETDRLAFYSFTKFSNGNFSIDDYFVMIGTDKNIDLSSLGFFDLFDNESVSVDSIVVEAESGDMAAALDSIWGDMGLKSVASKMISGLFLMLILALVMFGASLHTNHPLSSMVLIVVEFFFMILLVFIKLLPIWLPFIVVIVAAGIGAAVTKMGAET